MNCLYRLEGAYAFNENTTAFVEMEVGVNRHGLAVGLTFVYPHLRKPDIDDWCSDERCRTVRNALEQNRNAYTVAFAEDVLSGKYGFMCQYDRGQNADTVWSVVYDLKRKQVLRTEGNPSRKSFKPDDRMKLD